MRASAARTAYGSSITCAPYTRPAPKPIVRARPPDSSGCSSSRRCIASGIDAAEVLPESVVIARDIATQGNTSAASIPLAMETMLSHGQARPGDTALLLGYGAGLSYAAEVVTLPPIPFE